MTEGKEVIQRANELHGTFHLEKNCVYKKSGASRSFREPMQLGSLQFERPPDVQIYLPGFELGKSIPNSAKFGLGLNPKNPRPFLKKGRSKTFNPRFASSLCYCFQQLANIYGCILIDNCSLSFAHFFCISRL